MKRCIILLIACMAIATSGCGPVLKAIAKGAVRGGTKAVPKFTPKVVPRTVPVIAPKPVQGSGAWGKVGREFGEQGLRYGLGDDDRKKR